MALQSHGARRRYVLLIIVLSALTLATLNGRAGQSGPIGTVLCSSPSRSVRRKPALVKTPARSRSGAAIRKPTRSGNGTTEETSARGAGVIMTLSDFVMPI